MPNNPDTPNGFKPVRYLDGSPYNGAHNLYAKLVGYGTALFIGDTVQTADVGGTDGVIINGIDITGMPVVERNAVSTDMVGVIVGFYPNPTALETNHSPASTAQIVMVADAPNLIFEVQEDGVGGTFGVTDVGRNVDQVAALAGNTTTGMSALELDSSVASTTTTAGWRLLRLVPRPGNVLGVTATPNARWEVLPVEHMMNSRTGI